MRCPQCFTDRPDGSFGKRRICVVCVRTNNASLRDPAALSLRDLKRLANVRSVKAWRTRNRARFNDEAGLSQALRRSEEYRMLWPYIVSHYGGKCMACGDPAVCFDHVVPLAMGGDNTVGNGQPLCRACNTRKGNGDRARDYRPDKGEWAKGLVAGFRIGVRGGSVLPSPANDTNAPPSTACEGPHLTMSE
jgi:5-methylcytosine-specific restriction endonuclease McrA